MLIQSCYIAKPKENPALRDSLIPGSSITITYSTIEPLFLLKSWVYRLSYFHSQVSALVKKTILLGRTIFFFALEMQGIEKHPTFPLRGNIGTDFLSKSKRGGFTPSQALRPLAKER